MSTPRAAFAAYLIVVSAICNASTPDLPPPPTDPKLAAVLEGAKALISKAMDPSYLEMPATAQPWPCEVPDFQLRKIAFVLNEDEMDAKMKLAFRKSAMNAGMSSKDSKMTYRDAVFSPLVATCKNGLLDGPLEFFSEYTRIMDVPGTTMEIRMRLRYSMTAIAGEHDQRAPYATAVKIISQKSTYKDPAIQAALAKIKTPESKTLTATYVLPITADEYYTATITDLGEMGWMTMFQRPTAPGRSEMISYKGSSHLSVMPMKNGLPHGEVRTSEQKYNGFTAPASSVCYEDGEIIKTTNCDVQ